MGSISKCQKLNKQQNDKQCEDRISKLPSSLISHILSLLPTKNAVATSVLSTKWKLLWTLITSLDFDDKLLLHPEKSTDNSLQTCFANFVYRVLVLHRESGLRMFRLKGCQSYDVSHVNTWVAASLVRGVQELDLSIRINECTDHVLPLDLFTSRTMVVLKLGTWFVMDVPTSVRMQSLKILHLYSVEFIDDDSIYSLICGCPVLDELSMERCVGKYVGVIHIFAPVLTKLFLKSLACFDDGYETEDEVVVELDIVLRLDTPSLLYLRLHDDIKSVSGNLPHLINANFQSTVSCFKAVTDLLMGISSVQCLVLHGDIMLDLHGGNCRLPMFRNLTSLEFAWTCHDTWDSMLLLLKKSPRLENLVLSDLCMETYLTQWNPPRTVPTCLVSHLKVIKLWDMDGNTEELKMVEYFLKNAEVLTKLIIHLNEYVAVEKVRMEVLKKLLMLPRASKICQIEIC